MLLVPSNFDQIVEDFANNGYRVLACAYKTERNDYDFKQFNRHHIDSQLKFIGFIVFENQLKTATLPVLREISNAGIDVVMVTGDNILTAISVGRACNILHDSEPVFMPSNFGRDFMDLQGTDMVSGKLIKIQLDALKDLGISIACTGDVFDSICMSLNTVLLKSFMKRCRILGRMSPIQKKRLVEKFQQFDECVCFCGDGANDCAALMTADVGVSLSQAEASVAAPFTSNVTDISCILNLLKIGRSSIVASFVSFKFMSMYSIIQFTTLSLLYTFASSLTDWQFIYMDLILILPLGILINQYEPAETLSLSKPSVKLISWPVLSSIFVQISLQGIFQAIVYFRTRWTYPATGFSEGPNVKNIEATSLAMFTTFVYLSQALVYSEGRPHRERFSFPLIFYSLIILTGNILLLFGRINFIDDLMEFVDVPTEHRLFILFMALLHFSLAFIFHRLNKRLS